MKKKNLFFVALALMFLLSTSVNAQEKPVRIGLKFGIPNIAGLNFEYVTPVLGGKLAPSADFSYFGLKLGSTKLSFYYFELGANYYFIKEGRGPYANLSYGRMGAGLKYEDVLSDVDPMLSGGSAKANIGVNMFNIKLGAKLGGGFYFRPEIGYALASVANNINVSVEFPDGTKESQSVDVPGLVGGGFVFNLGFGVAF